MTCQSCTDKLKNCFQLPTYRTLSKIGAFGVSCIGAAISGYLGKRIYDTSLQVFRERIDCPGIELSCMAIVLINAGYVSLKSARFVFESDPSRRYTPRHLRTATPMQTRSQRRELVAFDPGEGAQPNKDQQAQVMQELIETHS